jgi:hypothetical protein
VRCTPGPSTRSLIELYNADPECQEYLHIPTVCGSRSREETKLRWWDLIEQQPGEPSYWKLTSTGALFVEGQALVRRIAHVYNNRLLMLCDLDGRVSIQDALKSKFNYDELMGRQGKLF